LKVVQQFHILLQLLGDVVQDPYRGSASGPHWETYVPQTAWPCPMHDVNPPSL